MLHADGSDQGTSFTDSSATPKTVTNSESYDSYTKLMLHMNGADASTTFTDSSTGKTVTANFNAQIDTVQNKFGEASGMFNVVSGYQDRLTIADSDDWNFGSGDFTIDFWVRFDTLTGDPQTFVSQWVDDNNTWHIQKNASNVLAMVFYYGGVKKGEYSYSWTPSVNTWYHLAFERYGSGAKIFIDGISQTLVEQTAFGTNNVGDYAADLQIADRYSWGYTVKGWLDELRISKGIARWTSDFTPPSSPYGKVATVTSLKKFGTASGEFKGSGEYLSLADSDDWNFGSGDFTVDTWVRFNAASTQSSFFYSQSTWADYNNYIAFYLSDSSNNLIFFANSGEYQQ